MGKATDFRDQAKGFSCSAKTTRSLHEVLSELGEEALSLAYSEVSAASRWARGGMNNIDGIYDLAEILDGLGESFLAECTRAVENLAPSSSKYGNFAMFHEVPDISGGIGVIVFHGIFPSTEHENECSTETVVDNDDVVPASKRLLSRILERIPHLKTKVRIVLEIRGFDTRWI